MHHQELNQPGAVKERLESLKAYLESILHEDAKGAQSTSKVVSMVGWNTILSNLEILKS